MYRPSVPYVRAFSSRRPSVLCFRPEQMATSTTARPTARPTARTSAKPTARIGRRFGVPEVGSSASRTSRTSRTSSRTAARAVRAHASNYVARVLAGEFEPTALRAREIAEARGQSLHALAHELGYAGAPPKVRTRVRLESISRTKLAALSGYALSDISRLFARRHPPTLTKLARIAKAYGAWMDDMLEAIGWVG